MNSDGTPRDLGAIQRWMQSVIMNPDGVEAGIESSAARDEMDVAVEQVERVICRSATQTSIERLSVYANAYYARLLEVLAAEYPALVHALGEDLFQQFAFGYLQKSPSQSDTLSDLSVNFPQYLAATRPDRDPGNVAPDWADFLIDLAVLERTYSEVFDGPGVERRTVLGSDELARIAPEEWPDLRLVPVPCLRLLRLQFAVHEYASAVRRHEEPELPAPAPTWLIVTRRNYVVRRVAVQEPEFKVLASLVDGDTIGEALTSVERTWQGTFEDLAAEVRRWFRDWSAAGYFLGIATGHADRSEPGS